MALLLFPLLAEENYYTVYFWKIPCVDITMILPENQEENQNELTFITKTKEVFSFFFPLENRYKTLYDSNNFQMLQYEKDVNQPNLKQTLTITWNSMEQAYDYQKIRYKRSADTHNIFSLLMRSRSLERESLDTSWWLVDHEGHPFRSRFLWIDSTDIEISRETFLTDHYRLDMIPNTEKNIHLVDTTDIFTWGITLDNCVRQIWIERGGKKRILRAEVKVRGFTLFAVLKNE